MRERGREERKRECVSECMREKEGRREKVEGCVCVEVYYGLSF